MSLVNAILAVEQGGDFLQSVATVFIFLSVLGFIGFVIVRTCKQGNFFKPNVKLSADDGDKIRILDVKFLYGRRCLYFVSCCKKKILFLVDRDHSCKLGEWGDSQDEIDR